MSNSDSGDQKGPSRRIQETGPTVSNNNNNDNAYASNLNALYPPAPSAASHDANMGGTYVIFDEDLGHPGFAPQPQPQYQYNSSSNTTATNVTNSSSTSAASPADPSRYDRNNPFRTVPPGIQGNYRGGLIGYADEPAPPPPTTQDNISMGGLSFLPMLPLLRPAEPQDALEIEYFNLKRRAMTIKFLAIIDILFSVFWFWSANWWLGFGLLFGMIGYIGASRFSRPMVFTYALYQLAILLTRFGFLIYYFADREAREKTTWSYPVLSVLTILFQAIIFAYIIHFTRALPKEGAQRYARIIQAEQDARRAMFALL
eukprot:GEZU01029216.1.p1 GENE.GEZU01029216.1~~GEZU01029216.1.p1  ORF type:complete len:315 (+),score=75.28 GEZU01029216.1:196-1140(+)